jgi:CHAD domain-containing protein
MHRAMEIASPPVRTTNEHELKLTAPEGFESVKGLGEPIEDRSFTTTYYDTPERALARAGVTLRRRLENGKNLWQLKLPAQGFRRELELPGASGKPPRALADALLALVRGERLEQAAKLKTRRAGVRVRENGRDEAEIVIDSVSVMDNGRVESTFREIEVELLDGDPALLDRIGKMLRQKGALVSDGRPKLFRALGIASTPPSAAKPKDAPLLHVAAMLEQRRREILSHDPGVRIGGEPEDVHQLRVAVRRSRAVLRAARPLLDRSATEPIRAELEWLGDLLGPVRDLDVLLAGLEERLATLPEEDRFAAKRIVQALSAERELARARLLEALESERYFALLDRLGRLGAEPPAGEKDKPLEKLGALQFKRLKAGVAKLDDDPTDAQLHRVRVLAKRARYTAELAEATVGKPATRFIEQAKELQDVLGEHQDAVVASRRIQEALASVRGSRVAFAAGRLVEAQAQRRLQARAAFPAAWKKLEKQGRRTWK